jgi:HSP20 family molecular chaperone IbpA
MLDIFDIFANKTFDKLVDHVIETEKNRSYKTEPPFTYVKGIPISSADISASLHYKYFYYKEEEKHFYQLLVEIPGFSKEEVAVEVRNKKLDIHAKHEKLNNDHLRKEFSLKELSLPGDLDLDSVSATLDNGVLKVCFSVLTEKKETGKRVNIL